MATQMAALRNLTHHRMGFRVAIAAATIGVIYGYDLGSTRPSASPRGCARRAHRRC